MPITDWEPPDTIDQGIKEKRDVIAEIQEIQAQLSDKKRKDRDPNFWAWRQKAIVALTNRLQELRLIKDWLNDQYKANELEESNA